VELDLAAAYASSPALPEKIGLNSSQMMFSVRKPGEWKKGWTLSKKELEGTSSILPDRGEEVMREIVRRHEEKLVATDYSFDLKSISGESQLDACLVSVLEIAFRICPIADCIS
jgi:hypothetical protein